VNDNATVKGPPSDPIRRSETEMFPNQVNALARQYTRELNERSRQPKQTRPAARAHGEVGAIRKNTGWTLVQIGLRIAAPASR